VAPDRPQSSVVRLASRIGRGRGLVAATLLALATVGPACSRSGEPSQTSPSKAAPAFATKSLDGEEVSLADYRGQVVLVNVWATWCDPCVRELPELKRLHEQLEGKGFTVIGLNTDTRSKISAVRAMTMRHQLPFPVWLDFESRSQVAFELRGYPTSILVDRQGNIRWRREGEILRNDPELMPMLEALLAE
jgi:cytochrome c biogenesis protein CcmG, thiol:disulfide interchange protein DsbE